ncbi:hypothetical protein [Streptomyces bohaiensis]|uniref:hypothetical protein n=2 Tax=Streptomyces bohaiensis TaxID=1431344 RepID=UPI003B7F9E0C
MTASRAARFRSALLGPHPGARHERHTAGRPLWRRYLASLLGVPLPPVGRPTASAGRRTPVEVPAPAPPAATPPPAPTEPPETTGPSRRGRRATARGPLDRLADATDDWTRAPAVARLRHRDELLRLAAALSPRSPAPEEGAWAAAGDGLSARALARAADLTRARALAAEVADGARAAHRGARPRAGRRLGRAIEVARGFTGRPVGPAPAIVTSLDRAADTLRSAATEFAGADLRDALGDSPSLAGVRWDSATRWPDEGWAGRMRLASAEDPPGSGSFVVLPEWRGAGAPSPTG